MILASLTVNGQPVTVNVEGGMPLLWLLRERLNLTGTKFGCGAGHCGACTVLVDDRPVRACSVPVSSLDGARVTTIEGLAAAGAPVLAAWIAEQAGQCGYCSPGMVVAAAALLQRIPQPTDADIDAAITNLCRCGGLDRVRAAIHRAARS
jgi:isoquinoline 1-oxidoreductase alpha subunit